MAFSADEVLQILDEGAKTYDFPVLDNDYFYFGKEKLILFRSSNEWLIVFQELSYSIKAGSFVTKVTAFGNKLNENGTLLIKETISEEFNTEMFDADGNFTLNPLHFKVVINGVDREFIPIRNDYQKIGIDIEDDQMPNEAKIIRYLSYIIPNDLFFSNDELLEICGRKDSNIRVFMELEDWSHPDLINDELPSENLCFQSIAKALEENDKNLYNCPKEEYNTHWSNWEWYKEE
jgi:hypothetical protein